MAETPEPTTLSLVKDALTALLAIYGAALSTFNWRQSVKKEKRALKVEFSKPIPVAPAGKIYEGDIAVKATNIGHRDVDIVELMIELPGETKTGRYLQSSHTGHYKGDSDLLPITLIEGKSTQKVFSLKSAAYYLKEANISGKSNIVPFCRNSLGEVYRGKSQEIDPADFDFSK